MASLVVSAAALALILITVNTPLPDSWGFRGFSILLALTFGTVGVVIAAGHPENRIGWLFLAVGALSSIQAFVDGYVVAGVVTFPGSLPDTRTIAWLNTWSWVPSGALAGVALPLLFPTGALPSRRWRPVALLGAIATIALSGAFALAPGPLENATFLDNPFGLPVDKDSFGLVIGLAFAGLAFAISLSVASVVVRFRSSRGDTRQQLKWFALAAAVAGTFLGWESLVGGTSAPSELAKPLEAATIIALMGIPISAGIAIQRYRLYEIDLIISRTISYAALTVVLGIVYAGAVLVLQAIPASLAGGDTFAVAGSTLLAAALFQPLRRRFQRFVDRRFYRARYDSARTVEAFAEQVRGEVDVSRLSGEMLTLVNRTVAPSMAQLWLRQPGPRR